MKNGYARKFLIPQGKAFEATKGNLRQLQNLKKVRGEREAKEIEEAEKIAAKLKKLKLKLTLSTGATGKSFGSITNLDIAKAVAAEAKIDLDRHAIQLDKPIKTTGKHEVTVKLGHDVTCFLKLTVVAEGSDEPAADDSEE